MSTRSPLEISSGLQAEPVAKPVAPRTVKLGKKHYPVVGPSIRDPRLHLAAVIISIHVLGQTALGFQVSVVQILVAILTCALIEVTWTLKRSGSLVWPASAMLTGSGVALIFRVIGTRHGDYWSWRGWYLFALVAGVSLVTKYVIRFRGSHVFNPSNVGLVAAFLILGSSRAEPLDFWWAPFRGWMVVAYLIILVGGLLITARLHLFAMSLTFWVTLAAGLGVVAASGHCMTARWAFAPVCGSRFWWVIVTSPEVLIFLFFMITDPRTVPAGGVGRLVFAACVAITSTLLIAPQRTEFGAKVGLLSGLVILCAARLPVERFFPAANSDRDRFGVFMGRLSTVGEASVAPRRAFLRGALGGAAAVFLLTGIIAAGVPARETPKAALAGAFPVVIAEIDPSTLPSITVEPDVAKLSSDLAGPGGKEVAVSLAENLATESQALLSGEHDLLLAVDYGDRLSEMLERIDDVISTGEVVVVEYTFASIRIASVIRSTGQGALGLRVETRGASDEITYDADGNEIGRTSSPFAIAFVLSRPTGGRWLIVATAPPAKRLGG